LKTILRLLLNDLKRDWKRPWAMLLLVAMPLFLSGLIASVFGSGGASGPMPTVHVAILDQDKDMLTGMLRSMPSQGDAAKRLRLHFVENREDGWRLVEKDKVSAFVVLPTNMTINLLKGQTNTIELYENPAQQILPKVVRQGVSLLAVGLSATAETLGEPLRNVRDMIRSNGFPSSVAVGGVASSSMEKLGHLRSYVFPPLVKFETVPAAEFKLFLTTNAPAVPAVGSNKVAQASWPWRGSVPASPDLAADSKSSLGSRGRSQSPVVAVAWRRAGTPAGGSQ
jgi:hypothetical protein